MAKNDTIELQQPLGYTGSGSSTSVAAKEDVAHYHGNENDQADMNRLGKKQRLDRNFSSLSVLGLTCVLMATWETMFITAGIGQLNGGRAGLTYVYIATRISTLITTASMAEMASMHVTLMTIAVALVATAFNTFTARRLPMFDGMVLYLHILLWFGFHVPAWVLAPKVSAAEVFGHFENWGGWPTMGVAVVLGQLASSSAFAGVDSAAHMAEEVRDASRTVPRMMMLTTI
ncbi:hypothetical protein Q7P35_008040 [Cladosporium inversicolor]